MCAHPVPCANSPQLAQTKSCKWYVEQPAQQNRRCCKAQLHTPKAESPEFNTREREDKSGDKKERDTKVKERPGRESEMKAMYTNVRHKATGEAHCGTASLSSLSVVPCRGVVPNWERSPRRHIFHHLFPRHWPCRTLSGCVTKIK